MQRENDAAKEAGEAEQMPPEDVRPDHPMARAEAALRELDKWLDRHDRDDHIRAIDGYPGR